MKIFKLLLFAALSMISSMGMAGALTTVTLTGTCTSNIINSANPYMQFQLYNSGNGFATNLVIEPLFSGFSVYNSIKQITQIGPNSTNTTTFDLYNFTMPGSYTEPIIVNYQQGGSSFTTMFYCFVNIEKPAQSLLTVSSDVFSQGVLNVTEINIANYTINATVTVFAPPLFTVQPKSENISVQQFSTNNTRFNIKLPNYQNATLPVAISISYIRNGLHFSSLSDVSIPVKKIEAPLQSYAEILIILIILAIIILILFSLRRNKKAKKSTAPVAKEVQQVQQ